MRYVVIIFKYLKSFCVENWNILLFICLDDKVISFVGKLGILKSIGVRKYNKVLILVDGLFLECIVYDFYVGDIVLFVCLRFFDIVKIFFLKGKIYV